MIYIYLTTDDQIILCDPEGEYRVLTRRLNGQTIMLSADSHDYINPMDIELEENMDDVLRLKSELILSFCEIVMDGKRNIPAEANSVIDPAACRSSTKSISKTRSRRTCRRWAICMNA